MSLPDNLKKFIVRCYGDIPPEKHTIMEVQLKEVVTNAIKNGKQFEIDWDRMVLPIHTAHLLKSNTNPASKPSATSANSLMTPPAPRSGSPLSRPQSSKHAAPSLSVSETESQKRRKRFALNQPALYVDEISLEPVVGRSKVLEKSYLRLTGTPNPDVVRPKGVLRKALSHVIEQYTTKARSYAWVADQIRAIRQDMTVQRIQDAFAIKVYEQNVRIALENNDLGEYNQCLTRLKDLYKSDLEFLSHEAGEFTAYQIFYLLYTNKLEDIASFIANFHDTKDEAILHAMKVVNALVSGNRASLFALYHEAPNLGKAALQQIVDRERISALAAITKATKGALTVGQIKSSLNLVSDSATREFIRRWVAIDDAQDEVDRETLRTALEEAKKVLYQVDIKGQI